MQSGSCWDAVFILKCRGPAVFTMVFTTFLRLKANCYLLLIWNVLYFTDVQFLKWNIESSLTLLFQRTLWLSWISLDPRDKHTLGNEPWESWTWVAPPCKWHLKCRSLWNLSPRSILWFCSSVGILQSDDSIVILIFVPGVFCLFMWINNAFLSTYSGLILILYYNISGMLPLANQRGIIILEWCNLPW